MITTDLIIIGSGPGGYRAAQYAAKNGLQVIIFEDKHAGGTCLNEGCIPTKSLVHDALIGTSFDVAMQRKNQIAEQLRNGVELLMKSPGIQMIHSHVSFKDKNTVITAEGEEFTAKDIIIATGSHAKLPPIKDIDRPEVMTSTELLNLDHLPKRLAIIGAGVIGMEFASIFHRMGTQVSVYEFLKECLPAMDKDLAKRLRKSMEKAGIDFHMGYSVNSIEELQADAVLVATGRGANTEGLNLEQAGIEYDRHGISVDDNMETNIKGIYAIGDVNARMMLAHAATFQGFRAINHILGKTDKIRFDIMPAAVFTTPEMASVGLNEEQAKAQEIEFATKKGFYRSNGKALAEDATEGIVKLLVDKDNKIIGCHILGAHASDLVQEIAALMNFDTTLDDLKNIIHIHPTLSEILQDIALNE
jgi:dihydrolipoamide dehydrogenase